MSHVLEVAAERILALAASRPATLGIGRLVCIDGPAGSGKTSLAAGLGAQVVHMDDLLPGWDGLDEVGARVLDLLEPLTVGRPARYRSWDWQAGGEGEEHTVAPAPLLVLEGVAAGNGAWAERCTVLVWVQADADVRLARGIARDGEAMRARWLRWMDDEQEVFAREQTQARADLVVPT